MANNRNFTHSSNFVFVTNLFNDEQTAYSIQEVNLPGLSFAHIQASKRSAMLNFQADTLNFNDLTLNLIVDEELKVWKEIVTKLTRMRDAYTTEGENIEEMSFLEIHDDNSNLVLKLAFSGCMIESIDDLSFTTISEDEIITCSVTLKYDYYQIEDGDNKAGLAFHPELAED